MSDTDLRVAKKEHEAHRIERRGGQLVPASAPDPKKNRIEHGFPFITQLKWMENTQAHGQDCDSWYQDRDSEPGKIPLGAFAHETHFSARTEKSGPDRKDSRY